MRSFCRKNHVRKIPLFWGGFWGGGGSADFIFMGARIFLTKEKILFRQFAHARAQELFPTFYEHVAKNILFNKNVLERQHFR